MVRGAHNIRSGLDMRWTNVFNENYNNSGGSGAISTVISRASTLNSNDRAGRQLLRLVPPRRAEPAASVDVNPKPHYQWFFVAPWVQDDWRVNNKLTLNLGFRWDFNGSVTEENNMLNYAFDPTIVNPVVGARRSAGLGGIRFAGVDGAPDRPWKLDKDNWQARVGAAYSLNEKTVFRAGYGQVLPQPDEPGQQRRVRSRTRR